MNLKAYLDDIENNPLRHLINSLPSDSELYKRAKLQYENLIKANWAKQVLDAWATDGRRWQSYETESVSPDGFVCMLTGPGCDRLGTYFRAVTPDAARIAATTALLADDPNLDPDGTK